MGGLGLFFRSCLDATGSQEETFQAQMDDYVELAHSLLREEFAASCPFPFLLGIDRLVKPLGPTRTLQGPAFDLETNAAIGGGDNSRISMGPLVRAVRKVGDSFPNMITVGRTSNNDVVIEDVQISK